MKCPHCDQNIPDQKVRKYVYSLMGKTTGKSKARTSEQARKAGLARWGIKEPGEEKK